MKENVGNATNGGRQSFFSMNRLTPYNKIFPRTGVSNGAVIFFVFSTENPVGVGDRVNRLNLPSNSALGEARLKVNDRISNWNARVWTATERQHVSLAAIINAIAGLIYTRSFAQS